MEAKRAKALLREIWGKGRAITPAESQEIRAVALPHPRPCRTDEKLETAIDTLLRIAGIEYDWRNVGSWNARNGDIMRLAKD